MSPDDPRHGKPSGATAHYRDGEQPCEPCRIANMRRNKSYRYRILKGVAGTVSNEEVARVLDPWMRQGLTASAIYRAAGCAFSYGSNAFHTGRRAYIDTVKAIQAVTDADFLGTDLVFADLTRTRIYSLRAAGQRLMDMPVDPKGVWRNAEKILVRDARAVRDYFAENEAKVGTNKNGAARALNMGHRPPLAWDDPGTLAWPDGRPELEADWKYRPSTRAEIVADLDERGAGISEVCQTLHISPNALEKWCERRGDWEMFKRLRAREYTVQEYRNQWTKERSA